MLPVSRTSWLDALAVAAAALVVGMPALLTYDGFMYDYTNHLWLVWVQGHAIASGGVPTYFLHTTDATGGAFNPFFMFYGGTLYALSGVVAAALGGSARIAYVGVILASIAAAYGGIVWLARQLGARSWAAHAPSVTFVASAYYVTNLYGRGAWPEFVAVSAVPLLVAAGTWIARAQRLNAMPCVLFVSATVIWSGSHNITLAWGAVALVVTIVTMRLLLARPLVAGRHRTGLLLGLLALAISVNAWFLVPNLLYAHDTVVGATNQFSWDATAGFNSPRALFYPLRYTPMSSGTPALYVQLPIWLLAWALVAVAVSGARMSLRLRRAGAACAIVFAGLVTLIMVEPLWQFVPEPLRLVQFAYRLNSYVDLLAAALVLVAVLAFQDGSSPRKRRLLAGLLAGAMTVSVGLCLWQLWIPNTHGVSSYDDLRDALVSDTVPPRTWYDNGSYRDASAPVVPVAPGRVFAIDPETIRGNRARLVVTPPPGREPFAVNLGGGPGVLAIHGLERVGRTQGGSTVAKRPAAGAGPLLVTIGVAGAPIVGTVISLLAILGLATTAVIGTFRRRRQRAKSATVR
jgi:hypothetical protein